MGKKNQWLIKNKEGLVEGPFSTPEILNQVKERGDVEGEFVSLYPGTKWIPVKDYDSFYDVLFKILSDELDVSEEEKEGGLFEEKKKAFIQKQEEDLKSGNEEKKGELGEKRKQEQKKEDEETKTLKEGDTSSHEDIDEGKTEEEEEETIQSKKEQSLEGKGVLHEGIRGEGGPSSQRDISSSPLMNVNQGRESSLKQDLSKKLDHLKDKGGQEEKKIQAKDRKKGKKFFSFFLFIMIFSLGLFLLFEEDFKKIFLGRFKKEVPKVNDRMISLFFPKNLNQNRKIPRFQIVQQVKRGLFFIEKDTLESDLKAMQEWGEALKGSRNNKNILGLLCMSYFKIFPLTSESFKEIQAVSKAFLRVSHLYPLSLQAYVCENVLLRLKEKNKEVQHLMERSEGYFSLLEGLEEGEKKPSFYTKKFLAFLFYFQALDFETKERFHEAYDSIAYAQNLWPKNVQFYVYEAWILKKLGEYSKALDIYEKILNKRPSQKEVLINIGYLKASYMSDVEGGKHYLDRALSHEGKVSVSVLSRAYFGLAHVFFKKKEMKKAFQYAKKSYQLGFKKAEFFLLKLDPKNRQPNDFLSWMQDRFLIAEGNRYLDRDQFHEAEIYFNKAYEKKGTHIGKAAFKIGVSLWRMNLRSESFKWFNKALAFDPYNEEAYFYISDYLGRSYDFGEAEKVLSQALSLMPRSYILLRAFSLLEKRKGHFQNMVAYAEEALEVYELDLRTYSLLVDGLIRLDRFNEAFSYASRAMEVDSHSPFVHVAYARALANVKGQDEAIEHLKNEVEKSPDEISYFIELAELSFMGGDYEGAKQYYFSALEKNPRYKKAYFKLGEMYKKLKYWNSSIEVFFKALSLDPTDADPLFEIAKVYLELKNEKEAAVYFNRALQVNPKYPLAHFLIGQIELNRNQPARALKHAQSEKKINRYNNRAYILAARSYRRLKQYNLCVDEYQKAINNGDKNSNTYVQMAECARFSGSLDVALSLLNVAQSLESGNPLIYRELGWIFNTKGEFERAKKSFNKYFSLHPEAKDRFFIQKQLGIRR